MNYSSTTVRGSGWALLSAPMEIRTPVLALKGLRPGPLDDGGKRGDFIIPIMNGQAPSGWFDPLAEQGQQIQLAAVEEQPRAIHAQVGDQDGGYNGIKDRDEFARPLGHDR